MADYQTIPSMGQAHENSCWAACLAWFLKQDTGGRPAWTQKEIMGIYWRSLDGSGAMIPEYMVQAWRNDTRLRMNTLVFPTPNATLTSLPLGSKPVCIAFRHFTGFAHMNVIWKATETAVWCMEPFWPYPGINGKRTGRFVKREIDDHFNYGDNVVLAWANPFEGQRTSSPAEAG